MLKAKEKIQKGFTIIEVLIVLAIGATIIIIALIAVPALNRNSRNTQRGNDVTNIGGALSEYVNNNGSTLPTTAQFNSDVKPNYKLSFYDASVATSVVYTKNTAAVAPAGPAAGALDTVQVHTFSKCNVNASTVTGANSRSVIALYRVETGGGDQLQCKEL